MIDPKHLGVTDTSLWTPTKRDALLFDHIVVGSLEKSLSEIGDDAVRRLATEDVNYEELQDELAEYVDGYTEYMRINKLKTSASALETIVTTGAEILESALKLKLATLAKSLFQVRHQRIALMEAELNAPGREVAYIVSAQEQFSGR